MEKYRYWIALGLMMLQLFFAGTVGAEEEREIEWTDSTRLALAQCFVGEAGWGAITEYAVIAHVLERRWRAAMKRPKFAAWTFEDMVRKYCAVHRVKKPTPRHIWVRNLPWGELEEDPGFEDTVKWKYYPKLWNSAREAVAKFENGEFRDPLPKAEHWGSYEDMAKLLLGPKTIRIRILPTAVKSVEDGKLVQLRNYFYAFK